MSEDMKVVISLKGTAASVGIQRPDCDPVFNRIVGDLVTVLGDIPGLVDQARRKWEASPKYPKTEAQLEPPAQPGSRPVTQSRASPQRSQSTTQPPMF